MPKITVIGSINMDLVTEVELTPKRGETVLGKRFSMYPGGKGANQAVAAAKLGADVTMVGCIGDDLFGDQLLENLQNNGIKTEHVRTIKGQTSGTAQITIHKGDNSIIVVPGANHELSIDDIQSVESVIENSDVILLQLEIPMQTVITAAKKAKECGVTVILNPAPYRALPAELIECIDYLTPNEHEYDAMMRQSGGKELARKLIITKGKAGTRYFDGERMATVPTYSVEAVDPTGAGDAFNGGLATSLASGEPLEESIHFANAVGALSVTQIGAQAGMPKMGDVQRFLRR